MRSAAAAGALRLRPPAVTVPEGAAWALRRAFELAPAAGPGPPPADAEDWSLRLGLVERIAWRRGAAELRRELGDERGEFFLAASRRTAARNLLLRELAALATRVAAARGIRVLLLKGIALLEELDDLDGARPLADVDVLVDGAAAPELSLALRAAGFAVAEIHESAQHLPALLHPRLGALEIHVFLPGVRLGGARWAAADEILSNDLWHSARELRPALVPDRRLLAAHAIAHGLVQNAHSPAAYPLLRVCADLQDLAGGGPETARLIDTAAPLLTGSVSPRELAALAELGRQLASGTVPRRPADAARIVDHVLAAHLDSDYRRSLKVRAFGAAVRRRDWRKIRRRAALAVSGDHAAGLPSSISRLFRVGWSWLLRRLRRLRRGGAANGL